MGATNVFLVLRRCSVPGTHAAQDNHYWRHHASTMVALREHQTETPRIAIRKCGFSELNHPPYSPDLAPSDYFIFRNLTKFLRGRRFPDDNAVKEAVAEKFDAQGVLFFLRVFYPWRTSINVKVLKIYSSEQAGDAGSIPGPG